MTPINILIAIHGAIGLLATLWLTQFDTDLNIWQTVEQSINDVFASMNVFTFTQGFQAALDGQASEKDHWIPISPSPSLTLTQITTTTILVPISSHEEPVPISILSSESNSNFGSDVDYSAVNASKEETLVEETHNTELLTQWKDYTLVIVERLQAKLLQIFKSANKFYHSMWTPPDSFYAILSITILVLKYLCAITEIDTDLHHAFERCNAAFTAFGHALSLVLHQSAQFSTSVASTFGITLAFFLSCTSHSICRIQIRIDNLKTALQPIFDICVDLCQFVSWIVISYYNVLKSATAILRTLVYSVKSILSSVSDLDHSTSMPGSFTVYETVSKMVFPDLEPEPELHHVEVRYNETDTASNGSEEDTVRPKGPFSLQMRGKAFGRLPTLVPNTAWGQNPVIDPFNHLFLGGFNSQVAPHTSLIQTSQDEADSSTPVQPEPEGTKDEPNSVISESDVKETPAPSQPSHNAPNLSEPTAHAHSSDETANLRKSTAQTQPDHGVPDISTIPEVRRTNMQAKPGHDAPYQYHPTAQAESNHNASIPVRSLKLTRREPKAGTIQVKPKVSKKSTNFVGTKYSVHKKWNTKTEPQRKVLQNVSPNLQKALDSHLKAKEMVHRQAKKKKTSPIQNRANRRAPESRKHDKNVSSLTGRPRSPPESPGSQLSTFTVRLQPKKPQGVKKTVIRSKSKALSPEGLNLIASENQKSEEVHGDQMEMEIEDWNSPSNVDDAAMSDVALTAALPDISQLYITPPTDSKPAGNANRDESGQQQSEIRPSPSQVRDTEMQDTRSIAVNIPHQSQSFPHTALPTAKETQDALRTATLRPKDVLSTAVTVPDEMQDVSHTALNAPYQPQVAIRTPVTTSNEIQGVPHTAYITPHQPLEVPDTAPTATKTQEAPRNALSTSHEMQDAPRTIPLQPQEGSRTVATEANHPQRSIASTEGVARPIRRARQPPSLFFTDRSRQREAHAAAQASSVQLRPTTGNARSNTTEPSPSARQSRQSTSMPAAAMQPTVSETSQGSSVNPMGRPPRPSAQRPQQSPSLPAPTTVTQHNVSQNQKFTNSMGPPPLPSARQAQQSRSTPAASSQPGLSDGSQRGRCTIPRGLPSSPVARYPPQTASMLAPATSAQASVSEDQGTSATPTGMRSPLFFPRPHQNPPMDGMSAAATTTPSSVSQNQRSSANSMGPPPLPPARKPIQSPSTPAPITTAQPSMLDGSQRDNFAMPTGLPPSAFIRPATRPPSMPMLTTAVQLNRDFDSRKGANMLNHLNSTSAATPSTATPQSPVASPAARPNNTNYQPQTVTDEDDFYAQERMNNANGRVQVKEGSATNPQDGHAPIGDVGTGSFQSSKPITKGTGPDNGMNNAHSTTHNTRNNSADQKRDISHKSVGRNGLPPIDLSIYDLRKQMNNANKHASDAQTLMDSLRKDAQRQLNDTEAEADEIDNHYVKFITGGEYIPGTAQHRPATSNNAGVPNRNITIVNGRPIITAFRRTRQT